MAVVTIATASPTPIAIAEARPNVARLSTMARSALVTLGGHAASVARPIAIAWFARIYGAGSLGSFLLIWSGIELGSRLATLGLDRGLQRWADGRRAAAAVAGMVIAGISALAIATALSYALPRILDDQTAPFAQLLVLVGLPVTAMGNVALRASRGPTQIATFVVARGVTEPLLFLVSGLVLSSRCDGSVALPASLALSIAGGSAVAAVGLLRTFGLRKLAATLVHVRGWPVRELIRTSIPLGLADLLQVAQSKLDLIAVAIITLSARAIASYAIAAEIASVFIVLRGGFDQIVAPLAADARNSRAQLARILTTAMRWSMMIAAPVAFVILVAPDSLLQWFGGDDGGALVLLVLAAGRAVEMTFAPAASMLAIIGEPWLSLLNAAAGLSLALLGQLAVGILGFGAIGIAIASSLGVIASSLLAVYGLTREEGIAPAWLFERR